MGGDLLILKEFLLFMNFMVSFGVNLMDHRHFV